MIIKKIILPLFLIIIGILLFEGGFYFGVNYTKSATLNSASLDRQLSSPKLPQYLSLYDALTYTNFKDITGKTVSSSAALGNRFLANTVIYLKKADQGMVKNTSVSYTFTGKIVELNQAGNSKHDGKSDVKNRFILSLENVKTGTVMTVDDQSNDLIKIIKVWSSINQQNKPVPITLNDLKVGDTVEVFETLDLLNEKLMNEEITLVSKGS